MQSGGLRTKGILKLSKRDKPIITIVTVVYNSKTEIEKTIQSVLTQTYDNVEYIIVDGASKDGTLDCIKKYEDEIDYWQSEPDKGIYDAMNKGIALATGDYIALLNAGDWYEKNTVEMIVENINKSKFDIYYGMLRIYSTHHEFLWIFGIHHNYIDRCMIAHPTAFVSKEVYKSYKYDIRYKSAADYDLFLTLFQKGKTFLFVENIMGNYALGGMSDSILGKKETLIIQYKHGVMGFFSFILRYLLLSFRGIFVR